MGVYGVTLNGAAWYFALQSAKRKNETKFYSQMQSDESTGIGVLRT